MKEIAVYEAKTRLSELLTEIERGEQFTITRRGLPVARLVQATNAARGGTNVQRKQVAAVFALLEQQRRGVVMDGSSKDWAAEGRD